MAQPAAGWRSWQRPFFGSILAWLTLAAAAAQALPSVPVTQDLAADGRLAGVRRQPLVILFSRAGCGWCDKVRREHLNAMAADPDSGGVFRQIDMDTGKQLTDFSGQPTSHRAFARQHQIRMTPTLMFFAENGRQLAPPIVGYRLAEFYGTLVEDAIEDSRRQLRDRE